MMNKTAILFLMLAVSLPMAAQEHRPHHGKHREITELVNDLSSSQKKKLDAIKADSQKRIDAMRAQQNAVRDSIAMYLQQDGDHSDVLFPLFDRESMLSRNISREMYTTKVRVDAVLTAKQKQQLRDAKRTEK